VNQKQGDSILVRVVQIALYFLFSSVSAKVIATSVANIREIAIPSSVKIKTVGIRYH